MTKMKKTRKLKEWFEIDAFWRHFLLNETTCFGQNGVVSCTVKKKEKEANGAVLNGTISLLLPCTRKEQGKKRLLCSPATPLFPSLSALTCQEKHDSSHTLPPLNATMYTLTCHHIKREKKAIPCSGWGGCAEATPYHPSVALYLDETGQGGLSLFLLINRGREMK